MKVISAIPLAMLLFAGVSLDAQETPKEAKTAAPPSAPADPFLKEKGKEKAATPVEAGPETHVNVGALIQYIDVKRELWTDWLSKNSLSLDATGLRKEVEGWIGSGDAELAETSMVMSQSGQRMKVESIRGLFYPTEFDPLEGGLPFSVSFECRNVGTTSEIDVILGSDDVVDINFAPERVFYSGEIPPLVETGTEPTDIRWPAIRAQKVTSQLVTNPNEWWLCASEDSVERGDSYRTLIFTRSIIHRFDELPVKKASGTEGILTFQWLETDQATLNSWLMEKEDLSSLVGGGLFAKAKEAKAKIVDEKVFPFRSGARGKTESILEVIHPTEYDQNDSQTFATPSAHETRNVGVTIEADPVYTETGQAVFVNMALERSWHFGSTVHHRILVSGKWEPNVTMPNFYSAKVNTQVVVPLEIPTLVAVMSPPDDKGNTDPSRKLLLFVKLSR